MVYQLNSTVLIPVLILDGFALFFLYRLVQVKQQSIRILAYATALLFACGAAFFKLLLSQPDFAASTPGRLRIVNNTGHWFQTFYYLREDAAGQPRAYWREYVFGPHKVQTLEIEDTRSLLVAKHIDGEWRYQRVPTASMVLKLKDARFHPDTSGRITEAIHAQQRVELGTYLSELLTLAVLFLLVYLAPALWQPLGKEPSQNFIPTT